MGKNDFKIAKGNPSIIINLHKDESDPRRHRSRCIHFDKNKGGFCHYRLIRCPGSAHCKNYEEKSIKSGNYSFTETYLKTIVLNEKACTPASAKVNYEKGDIVVSDKYGPGIVKAIDSSKGSINVYFSKHPTEPITLYLKASSSRNSTGNVLVDLHNKDYVEDTLEIVMKHQNVDQELGEIGEQVANKVDCRKAKASISEKTKAQATSSKAASSKEETANFSTSINPIKYTQRAELRVVKKSSSDKQQKTIKNPEIQLPPKEFKQAQKSNSSHLNTYLLIAVLLALLVLIFKD